MPHAYERRVCPLCRASAAATRILLLLFGPILALQATVGFAQLAPETGGSAASQQRDGQHDFDFEFGTWKTHLKRLVRPLTGSTTWVEYDGTTVVRKVWDGRANLVELAVDGPGWASRSPKSSSV